MRKRKRKLKTSYVDTYNKLNGTAAAEEPATSAKAEFSS